MKFAYCFLALLSVGLVGCGASKKTTFGGVPANDSVTDVSAPVPSTPPAYQPTPAPVAQPVVYDTMTPTGGSSASLGNGPYTVKKGDTLYGIARQRYGDGKQWTKIAAANPGLKANSLKVGQTITVP